MFIAFRLLAAALVVCPALAISPPDPKTLYTSTTKLNATDTVMAGLPLVPGVTHVQLHSGSAKERTYAHHAITEYIDKTLYVAWSSGNIDEDQMGQQSWVAKGALQSNGSWTFGSPRVVLPSALLSNQTSEANYTYWCSNDITQRGSQPNSFVKYGSAVYAVIEAVDITCFNKGASKYTRGAGRYVVSVSNDTSTGCWLTQNSYWTEHLWKNTPSGIGKSLCAEPLKSELTTLLNRPDIQPMTNEKLIKVGSYYAPDGTHTLQEVTHAVWFDDGSNTGKGYWQRFWRDTSGTNNTLFTWVEYSTSVNGSDWFPAVVQSGTNKIQQTNIPDSNTKTFYGSVGLASGPATYLVHNPQYYPDTRWRQPLAIAVAHDRIHFDQDRVIRTNASLTFVADTRGVKRVGLSYPHATVAGNELLVVYSEDKENIWMTRVPLSSLSEPVSTTTTTTSPSSSTNTTPTTSTTTTSSSSGSSGCTSAQWAQCSGIGWVGCTNCASGLTCTNLNDYYYQCL